MPQARTAADFFVGDHPHLTGKIEALNLFEKVFGIFTATTRKAEFVQTLVRERMETVADGTIASNFMISISSKFVLVTIKDIRGSARHPIIQKRWTLIEKRTDMTFGLGNTHVYLDSDGSTWTHHFGGTSPNDTLEARAKDGGVFLMIFLEMIE